MENYYFNIIAKTRVLGLLAAAFLGGLFSCSDFIEEDLSEKTVNVILPQSGANLNSNYVHFKWDKLTGADNYRLQIVKPSFVSISEFVMDSLVIGEEFYYNLAPGDYQFQLRAENAAYQSIYAGPYSFSVDSVSDLQNQLVPLLSPVDGLYTNLTDLNFSWQSIFAASDYEIQIRSGSNFNASATILYTVPGIVGTSHTSTGNVFLNEGAYSWGVRGANPTSVSAFSSRSVYVDITNPNDVVVLEPLDATTTISDTVVFKWSSGVDPGTIHAPLSYELQLATDVGFGSYTTYQSTVDSLELVLPTDTYYWRVFALDGAGNQSVYYSSEFSVTVP